MRAMGGPPTKETWHGPITNPLDPSLVKRISTCRRRAYPEIIGKDTACVMVRDDEDPGQREITWHRSAYPQEGAQEQLAPAAGLILPRQPFSLSAPVSEAGPSRQYGGQDDPAGKPRFAYGGRHDVCGPGFTHDRVIRHEGEGQGPSYETSEARNAKKLYKAAQKKNRDASLGKHHPRLQAEPWDEAIAIKMKARQQEDEWRRCIKKRARGAASEGAGTQLTARTARSMVPTSCSMVTAGLCNNEADRSNYTNGAVAYGKMLLPLCPEDVRSVVSSTIVAVPDEDDYKSVIGMCRTDRLSRMLRTDGERP